MHRLRGARLTHARRDIGFVFQQFNLVRRLSALDNALAGRLATTPLWRVLIRRFAPGDRADALAALDRVGLRAYAQQRADRLSGGQYQRQNWWRQRVFRFPDAPTLIPWEDGSAR